MYVIRVRAEDGLLGVSFSGRVSPEEALRAVSQAFALAEAGGIARCICDLRDAEHQPGILAVLGAMLAARILPGQRVAVICAPDQLSYCRRLARLGGFDERLGTFTRDEDATEWLQCASQWRLAGPALRHFQPLVRAGVTQQQCEARAAIS